MYLPSAVTKHSEIQAAIDAVERSLAPDVAHIRYEIGEDWSGQWAIFFRVLLSDDASEPKNLRDIAPRVVWRMSERLDLPGLGLFPYFNFRSEAEQEIVKDSAWA